MPARATLHAPKNTCSSRSSPNFREDLAKHAPELFNRALGMCRSPHIAEDLVQDTLERALRFKDSYQAGTNLRAWLFQVLFSVFITRCRRARRERNALGSLAGDPLAWTAPEPSAPTEQLSPPVARALDGLPEHYREVVVLVDIEELSYKDAARRLGVPNGTVMSRLHRGRRALVDALGGFLCQPAISAAA